MINPALSNLENELRKEDQDFQKKQAEERELAAKNIAISNKIKNQENDIRTKKGEITTLEKEVRFETDEIKKNAALDTKLVNELRDLEHKREADHLRLTRITRENNDAMKKQELEKRSKTQARPSVN